MPEAVIGLDAGVSSHWACIATGDGEIQLSTPVANKEGDLDSPFGRFPDALVVVDQSRNIVRPRARPSQGGCVPSSKNRQIRLSNFDTLMLTASGRAGAVAAGPPAA